jgi:hypothetical protein
MIQNEMRWKKNVIIKRLKKQIGERDDEWEVKGHGC